MLKEQEVVLVLIRMVVSGKRQDIDNNVDWNKVFEIATEQGVLGLCFNAIEMLSIDQRPDMENLMEWIGLVSVMESTYERHISAIQNLSSFFNGHGIKMMVLKGYGLSLFWSSPNRRPVGDIDIYTFGKCKLSDKLIREKFNIQIDDSHEHHTCFKFMNFTVENHYDFVNTRTKESSRDIEIYLKQMSNDSCLNFIGDVSVYLPSCQFNSIFLIRHLGQHFAGAEATLRQILDWGFFIQCNHDSIDWGWTQNVLQKVGTIDFFHMINSICVDYLGFQEDSFPKIKRNNELERRIFRDILSPEFSEEKPNGGKMKVVFYKTRRFFANKWKRQLVFKEDIFYQFFYGTLAHLRRLNSIQD